MAKAAGLPITPHSANLGLVTLFTMHLLRAIEGAGKYLEFSIEGAGLLSLAGRAFREIALSSRRMAM